MGMYTELIFGASLKKDTPPQVINALRYMAGSLDDKPDDFPLPEGRCEWLLTGGSYYFAVNDGKCDLWEDNISKVWILNSRSNIKNYANEIETFLAWIKPHIAGGSGRKDMYAVVMYEEDSEPTMYYLHDNA